MPGLLGSVSLWFDHSSEAQPARLCNMLEVLKHCPDYLVLSVS